MENKIITQCDLQIIPMEICHIPQIMQIEQECFGNGAWSENLFLEELSDSMKHYFVAVCDKTVLGYGGYAHIFDEAHIMNIAVLGLYQNRGVATAIIKHIFDDATQRQISAITLEVKESNTNAIHLYQKSGFVLAGIRKRYYDNKHNALIYWKRF